MNGHVDLYIRHRSHVRSHRPAFKFGPDLCVTIRRREGMALPQSLHHAFRSGFLRPETRIAQVVHHHGGVVVRASDKADSGAVVQKVARKVFFRVLEGFPQDDISAQLERLHGPFQIRRKSPQCFLGMDAILRSRPAVAVAYGNGLARFEMAAHAFVYMSTAQGIQSCQAENLCFFPIGGVIVRILVRFNGRFHAVKQVRLPRGQFLQRIHQPGELGIPDAVRMVGNAEDVHSQQVKIPSGQVRWRAIHGAHALGINRMGVNIPFFAPESRDLQRFRFAKADSRCAH